MATLLLELRNVGAGEQVTALAARAATEITLHNQDAVDRLLESMREVGAGEQATALASRLSAVGRFDQFIQFSGNVEQFRLGREPDGSAAPSWTWTDLD
ncbi:hypothetical protein ACFYUG_32270 [Streptomyces albogriseolus]|uniref:hypothetical protein n=1 Tax=Streptomyces TaxID=1883 RepID=UPI000AC7E27C|nr:hypothetical protein [Streptomyces sp. F-7]